MPTQNRYNFLRLLLALLVTIHHTRAQPHELPRPSLHNFCFNEPRIRIDHAQYQPTSYHLHIPPLDLNPNHALHDRLWAISHYLLHCGPFKNLTLILTAPRINATLCTMAQVQNPPSWGVCLLHALTSHTGLPPPMHISPPIWPPPPHKSASTTHIYHGVPPAGGYISPKKTHFRHMHWISQPPIPPLPLPSSFKSAALNQLRTAAHATFNPPSLSSDRIHILIYNRQDARRRNWANAAGVEAALQSDTRLEIRFTRSAPSGLPAQVALYTWADVVVAPHGAAMANTVFMRNGTEIVEIWKYCDVHPWDAFVPRDWTGWHASLLGIGLSYGRCFDSNNGHHVVRINEVVDLVRGAVERVASRRERKVWQEKRKDVILPEVLIEGTRVLVVPVRAILLGGGVLAVWCWRGVRKRRSSYA